MLFGPGILLAAGGVLVVAMTDSLADSLGYHWLGTAVKFLVPLAGLACGVYFLEMNPITLRWLP
ncbi:hypothetical protein A8F94_17405 [Bacillus sp. FJAT-27225]|uniref:hypothetical protein n=1 Tax=Bacillus sp. FJAT-27225 TaxID=1743144 RepID=UPI00080C2C2C|nr:hypothetical protein [Bacillus sp. FJAT-27225]OCA84474.1 hypothetical protein A8F94_17405 [Bacillus sp. FJAT-27225]